MQNHQVIFRELGTMEYKQAWDYQESLLKANVMIKSSVRNLLLESQTKRIEDNMPESDISTSNSKQDTTNYFLFVEHPPVYTLGKSGRVENILINEQERFLRGITFFATNRGGDITFHGPGQIVGYPILDLENFGTDIGKYLRNLEEIIIRTLSEYGIKGERSAGETGVWIDADRKGKERKICAIGVRCSRWITMHGFAFNINTDLNYFNDIIPCGIHDKKVTSLGKELGMVIPLEDVKEKIKKNFRDVFQITIVDEMAY